MSGRRDQRRPLDPLREERGTIVKDAPFTVALGYPAPYAVAASSLGAQVVYGALNRMADLCCERFFLPEKGALSVPLVTAERRTPVGGAAVIAFSVACETELAGVASLLEAAGLEPLAGRRAPRDPAVITGGPLTAVDPRLLAPLSDVVAVGESEETLSTLGEIITSARDKETLLDEIGARGLNLWRPRMEPAPPPFAVAPLELLPAVARTWSPEAELRSLFLIEATRGCARSCSFCVMCRKASGGSRFRAVPPDRIVSSIPGDAPGVGLVGAAVTDHPEIERIVGRIVETGKRVSLSSIRADRLTPELARLLKRGGLRTLTIAADGSSDGLRRAVRKGITAEKIERAASIGAAAGIRNLRIYSMVGLPGEEDEDIEEFSRLLLGIARNLRVSVTVQAFVPKPGTPLAGEVMAERALLEHRLALLKSKTKGQVYLLPTSPRWSWVDWKLAHAGERAALAAVRAQKKGATFGAWKSAVNSVIG